MEDLRGQPLEVWRTAKVRLDRRRSALSQRGSLERRYEKAQAGPGKRRGLELVDQETWEARLDRYAASYERWQLGLCDKEPGKPSFWRRP